MHDVQAKNNNNVKDIKYIDGLMPQPSNNKICIFQETIFFNRICFIWLIHDLVTSDHRLIVCSQYDKDSNTYIVILLIYCILNMKTESVKVEHNN